MKRIKEILNQFVSCCTSFYEGVGFLNYMRILIVLGGASLIVLGIAVFLWSLEEFADDNDFQGHPPGEPFNANQQAEYQRYQIIWSVAGALVIGGAVTIFYGARKK